MKRLVYITIAFALTVNASAQTVKDFQDAVDSLQTSLPQRMNVKAEVKANKVVRRGLELDFHFTSGLGELPWRTEDIEWLRGELSRLMPESCSKYSIGAIYAGKQRIESLAVPAPGRNGKPAENRFTTDDPRNSHRFITAQGRRKYSKGLSGRNIALWQSHGRYFEEKTDRWEWQRPPLFQTVEDMYTQSYVLSFLIPMLENAGAYVMTPRERDLQTNEIVADNDPAFENGRGEGVRIEGRYSETGTWSDAGTGFADTKAAYSGLDNPFLSGTARKADCLIHNKGKAAAARWAAEIPQRGEYAVYISYKSLPNSTECAHYTVTHLGGESSFTVNQKIGGGTWIYLGTFEFDKGSEAAVTLDNKAPEGFSAVSGTVITADAVRFGGGMGKIARGRKDAPVSEYATSGLPSFAEGAFYWMQWAGADSTILSKHEDDYTSDFADRGAWVGWMSGGSSTNPDLQGLGIPIDLALAFHTDAGVTPNDSTVGTLSIYTLKCDGSDKFPNGEDRLQQRMYADFVQTQVVDDVRSQFDPDWIRRGIWDRSYSESRTATVPAMILELLSHQNFADMKYGLDPSFRFTVCRAVYKGILKYLSARYGCAYAVQPLPVNSFAAKFVKSPAPGSGVGVKLSWKASTDTLEPTAVPKGYILQTRLDDGTFDSGRVLDNVNHSGGFCSTTVMAAPGHIFSYRITAFNDGGKSFPSETVSIGVPENPNGKSVLVVNNFTRVSAPAWFDTPEYAGFNSRIDAGVPFVREINFIGEQYETRRSLPWLDDDNPGFGACWTDEAAVVYAGNTFDYSIVHGKALMKSGYSFHSASVAAVSSDISVSRHDCAMDIICGKQVTTKVGAGKVADRYRVFPSGLQEAVRQFTGNNGGIIISGAYIGTDVWDGIYPVAKDSAVTATTKEFVEKTLGYKWMTGFASRNGAVRPMKCKALDLTGKIGTAEFHKDRNPLMYNVETPDGIVPSGKSAGTFLRYTDTCISAGVCFNGDGYRAVSLGFPIETLKLQSDIDALMESIMTFIDYKQ